jgi:ABC transporter DrrB family efflux protein
MSPRITAATALRVLRQLRRDPRSLALVLFVPPILITIFRYVLSGQPETFDRIGGPMVGIFPFTSMFVVTSIAMLRERTTGTLERLMTLPLAKLDLLLGYALAFSLVATAQACITAAVAFGALELEIQGAVALVILLAVANALLGMSMGLFVSAFARTEFQAVQFLPAFVFPQLLLCGLVVPRDKMDPVLELVSYGLPLTWAFDALDHAVRGGAAARIVRDALIVIGAAVASLALGATTLRRRTP